jgi:superfamily II DNA or RNA helicase
MEIDDITDFLPIYPDINDVEFNMDIYRKKEFYNDRLEQIEEVPKVSGQLLKNQKIMARYMSSRTPYDNMLIVNEMGTGKTCLTTGIIEQIKNENSGFKKAIILARGEGIINNFKNEIVFKCTSGEYIPENYDSLTSLEATHRMNKLLDQFYEFRTFVTFAKMIDKTNSNMLRESYNNSIIVIDEVHNLRLQDKEEGINVYKNIWNFLHLVVNCKIILLSGTPMKDSPEEISSIMNLILPVEDNLPTGQEFIKSFMDVDESTGLMKIKKSKTKDLKRLFKGKISYLLAMKSEIPMEYEGIKIENELNEFKVEPDQMSPFQSEVYNRSYNLDINSETKGIYSNSRQATLFVFPDGSYGEEGFKKYIDVRKDPKTKKISFRLKDNLRNLFRGSEDDKLEILSKFSSKYSITIANILKSRREGKSIFIYCEFVQGSGAILFASLLEQFGFNQATGNEGPNQFGPRYAIITNTTATLSKMKKIITRFNKPDNLRGQVINVIIGSKVISEGFSLLNVQVVNILTPHWNYSEIAQAIARGYRLGSHNDLIKKGIRPTFNIYQRVSLPMNNKHSIDLEMYKISEIKDINIKQIERVIKESAFDCPLNYERNRIRNPESNGRRECEYMDCDYKCDLEPSVLSENDIDNSTYQLYYSQKDNLIQEIKKIYRSNFILSFEYLSNIDELQNYTDFELINSLNYMIINNIEIINKYSISSYLRESNNIYFLVDNLTITGDVSLSYYTRYPILREDITLDEIMEPIYIGLIPSVIDNIFQAQSVEDLPYYFNKLSNEIIEIIIENSIISEINNLEKNRLQRSLILKYFENYFKKFEDEEANPIWVCWYLLDKTDVIRFMAESDGEWLDGDDNIRTVVVEYKQTLQNDLDNNNFGFYGQINKGMNKFCIRDVRTKADKKHKQKSGRVCKTIKRCELINLASRILSINGDDQQINNETDKSKLWNKIITAKDKDAKYLLKSINSGHIELTDQAPIEEIRRFLYWRGRKVEDLCDSIQNWFDKNGLLVEDAGCGKQGRTKI